MKSDSGTIFGNATAYEGYVGRWSRPVAQRFLDWLAVAPGVDWLDVGAGTGILTDEILQKASPASITAVDLSPEYVEFARQRIHDARVEFRVDDAMTIAFEAPQFDAAVSGLVLNFVPDYAQVARNMAQAVRNGGTVAAYVWDYGGHMEMVRHFWDAAIQVDPSAREADPGSRFTICNPDNLSALWQSLGLQAVEAIAIDVPTRFKDFDDYWLPFLGAQGSVAKYVHSLSDETRSAVRDQLQRQLPTEADGGIPLIARAWAVKGTKGISG